MSLALFSGFNKSSTVPLGSLAKASSVGANTVKGPGPFNVSTKPAAPRAAAKVEKDPAATAVSTMSAMLREVAGRTKARRLDGANPETAERRVRENKVKAFIIVGLLVIA